MLEVQTRIYAKGAAISTGSMVRAFGCLDPVRRSRAGGYDGRNGAGRSDTAAGAHNPLPTQAPSLGAVDPRARPSGWARRPVLGLADNVQID